ncbi:MAG: sugar transferase [Deltaproteobacteria bacterium]|nr:sugar transferase [Deltaproteobacteria bacterium]
MRILFFQEEKDLLRQVCVSRPFGSMFINQLNQKYFVSDRRPYVLLPEPWLRENPQLKKLHPLSYLEQSWRVSDSLYRSIPDEIWFLNGRVFFTTDGTQLNETLRACSWDVATVQICADLKNSKEIFKLTPQGQVVGFRRFYTSSVEPTDMPDCWPPLLILKKGTFQKLCTNGGFPTDFQSFKREVSRMQLNTLNLRAGGEITSFDEQHALLDSMEGFQDIIPNRKEAAIAASGCRVIEPVFIGKDVTIESGAGLIGPVVLSDGVHVKSGSVVRRSILGEGLTVEQNGFINNQVCLDGAENKSSPPENNTCVSASEFFIPNKEYRKWPFFSYARLGKRVFDIITSLLILIMLVPIFPLVILMIKLSSPGPIFYKARRQGLWGKEFSCLKFRTMVQQADAMQERLRVVNQVDGPQFKIENDPRISGAGKFLRDTCIDELPQFINVLLGQMSIVGPRPSPENENDSCPTWRDARLSVRPGITGLWQILRTRQAGEDFQEWVYYDTQYVRNLSFGKDLWICAKTAHTLIDTFLRQFG